MLSYFLPFPKVLAKNIYHSGQKLGEANMAHLVSN